MMGVEHLSFVALLCVILSRAEYSSTHRCGQVGHPAVRPNPDGTFVRLGEQKLSKRSYDNRRDTLLRMSENVRADRARYEFDNITYKRSFGRVVNGFGMDPVTTWPWIVDILPYNGRGRCTGSLLSDKWVITAGHCFVHSSMVYGILNFGANSIKDSPILGCGITLADVHRIPEADVTLINIEGCLSELNEFIQPVCLPSPDVDFSVSSQQLVVVGYGYVGERKVEDEGSNGKKTEQINAEKVQNSILSFLPNNQCVEAVGTSFWGCRYGNGTQFDRALPCSASHEHMIMNSPDPSVVCAIGNNSDSCEGDSGGPLLVYDHWRKQWEIAAIVTSGSNGCKAEADERTRISSNTAVPRLMSWIKQMTGLEHQ